MSDADIDHTEQEQWESEKMESPMSNGIGMSPWGISKLAEALSKAQLEITGAVKDSSNPFFKSTYADLASVLDAMKPLNKYGLALIQMPIDGGDVVKLVTTLVHSSGEWMQSTYSMRPVKNDPQGIGSCITYMRRYAASAFCGIAQVDDDGNAATQPKQIGKPGADAGKINKIDISPEVVRKVVSQSLVCIANNDSFGLKEIWGEFENEQQQALWGKFDSTQRGEMKRLLKSAKESDDDIG
jgi:hypothetical protein